MYILSSAADEVTDKVTDEVTAENTAEAAPKTRALRCGSAPCSSRVLLRSLLRGAPTLASSLPFLFPRAV